MAKYLWRAAVRGISRPIYLVAQNIASATANCHSHPQVDPADVIMMQRIDPWDTILKMTVVHWPEPPPEPEPEPEPPA